MSSTVFEAQAVVLLPDTSGHDRVPAGAGHLRLVPRCGPRHRALGLSPTGSRPGSARTRCPARTRCIFRSLAAHQAGRRAGSAAGAPRAPAHAGATPSARNLCRPDRCGAGTRAARRRTPPSSRARRKPRACATRCSTRSRTICARRSRCSSAHRRAWSTRRASSQRRGAARAGGDDPRGVASA